MTASGKKPLLIIIGLVLAAALYFFTQQPKFVDVEIITLEQGEVRATVSNTRVGTVKACRRAYLAPATGGQVAVLHVNEGDSVKQNQLLLEIWNKDLKAQVKLQDAQIRANRASAEQVCQLGAGAEREADRVLRLQKFNNIISEEQVDIKATGARAKRASCTAALEAIAVSQANRDAAQAAVERTLIVAPFDGTVAEINAELGEFITPSPPGIPTLPAIDLLDVSCLYVSAPIDEVDAPQIKTGMSACVSLDAFGDKRCSGTVSRIAPYVLEKEKQARTVEVEVKLTDPKDLDGLLPGYSADIEVLLDRKAAALRVPAEAVLENNRVLLMRPDGLLEERSFKPGLADWNIVEVLSGLNAGDKVVLSVGREGVAAGVYAREQR
ncbi:MAG: efflux RND transporter periplasmic adaptor subunit [Methylobacter sp.]|nr:efflux RND transporter periplasmic adaptor subunit [Methylobacter sp.]MDP2428082.1 efflux RND transporter periplasmic adaptor subunit [Methylobacter sp.]MDP3055121.1 efflux RND transporter periplasmic adaptor subunit [Methylobacter sp.]MDP3362750.1 efflux RND transporter periplasmic adaptor subunit [Methylobacter sp.]MDZ4217664.1 efflux RND transporter periplasmic adaptor subunit [Methylobacter sp.]